MLKSRAGRRLIQELPKDRILTETDGPFISVDGEPAVPWDVSEIIRSLASLWEISVWSTEQLIWGNFRQALYSATEYRSDSRNQ
jgi:TatD DNase family protein